MYCMIVILLIMSNKSTTPHLSLKFSSVTVAWHKHLMLIAYSNPCTHTKLLHFSEGDTSHIQLIMSHLQDVCRLSLNHIAVSPKILVMLT